MFSDHCDEMNNKTSKRKLRQEREKMKSSDNQSNPLKVKMRH
jgi:hypothetical protein